MKQSCFHYTNEQQLRDEVGMISDRMSRSACSSALFHIHTDVHAKETICLIAKTIRELIPGAFVVGSSSYGNICEGRICVDDIAVTVNLFEKESTRLDVLYVPIEEGGAGHAAEIFVEEAKKRPWIRAVETLLMIDGEPLIDFCETMNSLPEEIEVFGGACHFAHSFDAPRFLINQDGECFRGVIFIMYGGEDFYVRSSAIRGWKPLGRPMVATSYEGNVVKELNGEAAYDLYYRYLKIENDDNFFYNVLEFPFLFDLKSGASVLRMPVACLPGGAMVLAAAVPPDSTGVRLAYGDPGDILQSVIKGGHEIEYFRPDGLFLFSCGARRAFWTDASCNRETEAFSTLAPANGFYTAGELLRVNGTLTEHNSTLVIIAMREGDVSEKPEAHFEMNWRERRRGQSLVIRFANFINAAMDELEEANRRLQHLSITDGLTGLLNRREIERRIRGVFAEGIDGGSGRTCELMMLDLDDFKHVNDTYGHQEGDRVLQAFSELLIRCAEQSNPKIQIGRWGGEEFILLLDHMTEPQAMALAEMIRTSFAACTFEKSGSHTVSIGVTCVKAGEDADTAISRADQALYEAKAKGKNLVAEL